MAAFCPMQCWATRLVGKYFSAVDFFQREVFGRELMKHEFDGMPESDKRTLADRIMQLGEERRQRELDTEGF